MSNRLLLPKPFAPKIYEPFALSALRNVSPFVVLSLKILLITPDVPFEESSKRNARLLPVMPSTSPSDIFYLIH